MPGRRQQTDSPVAEEVQLPLDATPAQTGLLEVLAHVSVAMGRLCAACRVELEALDENGRGGEVSERAGVVDVQMGLHQEVHRLRLDPQATQLGQAMLLLCHAHAELLGERAPVRARIPGDGERIPAVHHDVALGVADQVEGHRHLHAADLERAAAEQVEPDAGAHAGIVCRDGASVPGGARAALGIRCTVASGGVAVRVRLRPRAARCGGSRTATGIHARDAARIRATGMTIEHLPGDVGMADLQYEVRDGVGTILLNRPHRKNAFTLEMIDEWAAVLVGARTDPDVRALVLTGAGDGFCSGIDLDTFTAQGPPPPLEAKRNLTDRIHRVAHALQDLDKPVIAAVNGVAVGAGMDMALMCDIRLAARSARFSEGYVRVGLVPGDGGCYFLPRLVGTARALELLLTGDFLDAVEAERIGIVNHVYDDDRLMEEANALARRLADGPPVAIAMIKRAVYQSADCDLRTALDLISSHMAVVQSTSDSQEALRAFAERRTPIFEGR